MVGPCSQSSAVRFVTSGVEAIFFPSGVCLLARDCFGNKCIGNAWDLLSDFRFLVEMTLPF